MDRVQVRLFAFFDIDGVAHAIHREGNGYVIFHNAVDGTLLALAHDEMARMFALGRLKVFR
ncbi:MAG: hypothetical protein K2Y56_17690 [Methylobacterium sp.]|uniref:hypothetical protein n=1 Tax=Methylobacterium sp. TaxID=409 RepID=UPI0025D1FF43|nr:hypothetical protein [Methylobacterium sp.]MBX9933340.1 hypothetical protein [Methylobacterium sp.]